MTNDAFDKYMRAKEAYHDIKVPEDKRIIIRVDGRSFSKLTLAYKKPFSSNFNRRMDRACVALTKSFGAEIGYHQSDEISILLPANYKEFNRSLEKLVSISASTATQEFNLGYPDIEMTGQFDSRVILFDDDIKELAEYFRWRQNDAIKNGLNSACYWGLRNHGISKRKATSMMSGITKEQKEAWVKEYHNKSFLDFEQRFRNGIMMFKTRIPAKGFNPISMEEVETERTVYMPFSHRLTSHEIEGRLTKLYD